MQGYDGRWTVADPAPQSMEEWRLHRSPVMQCHTPQAHKPGVDCSEPGISRADATCRMAGLSCANCSTIPCSETLAAHGHTASPLPPAQHLSSSLSTLHTRKMLSAVSRLSEGKEILTKSPTVNRLYLGYRQW